MPKTKPNSFIELVNDQLEKHKIDFQILNRIFNDHHDRDSTLTFYSNPSAFAQECESDRWNDNIQCGHSTVCDCVNQILAQVKRELTFTVTVNLAVTHKLNLFRTLLLHRMTTIDGFQAFHLIFETKSSEPQHKSAVDAMVVARESDWIGAVDVILSYPRHCALFVFVQESVHKSFYQRLIQQIKLQHLLFVVDDEICVTSNRDRVSKMNVPHTHVILFKYRNIQEAIGLVRQAQPINRTLLWLNSIALGQDVATKIDRCSAFWLDSVPFETRTGSKYFGRACCIDRTNRGRANPLSLQERAAQLTQIGRLTLKHNESKAMIEQVAACKRLLHQVQVRL